MLHWRDHRAFHMAIACTTLLLLPGESRSQVRMDEGGRVEIQHRARKIITGKSHDESSLDDVNRFEWKSGSRVAIVITDQNPLLFTYDAKVTETENEQHKLVTDFASTLGALVTSLGGRTGGGSSGVAPFTVEGVDFKKFRDDLDKVRADLDEVPSVLTASLGSAEEVAEIKRGVASWKIQSVSKDLTEEFAQLSKILMKCMSGLPLNTSMSTTISCADPMASALRPDSVGTVATGQQSGNRGTPPQGSTPPGKSNGAPTISHGPPPKPGTSTATSTLNVSPAGAPRASADPSSAGTAQRVLDFLLLASVNQAKVEQGVATLTTFATDVAAINTPKTIADRTYNLNDQRIDVTVVASTKYADFMTADVKDAQASAAKNFAIVLTPYTPAILRLAPAAVFVFPGAKRYAATPSGSAFTIDKTRDDVTAYDVAAMLMITPRAWNEPTVGGSFQIGVTPAKDRIGLYAGLGLNLWDKVSVGGGFAYRQDDRLAHGLHEDQSIATADALKTERRFAPGFYLHITAK